MGSQAGACGDVLCCGAHGGTEGAALGWGARWGREVLL